MLLRSPDEAVAVDDDDVLVLAVDGGVLELVARQLVAAAGHLVGGGVDDHQVVDRGPCRAELIQVPAVELVQVLLDQCEYRPSASLAVPVVLEGQVPLGLEVLVAERDLGRAPVHVGVGVLGALLRAVLVAVLEGGHPVEPAAVRHRVVRIGARQVADGDHAGDRLVEVDVAGVEPLGARRRPPAGPRAGEAVGLQLEVDRAVGGAEAGLDGVAVLVGDDDGDRERAELLVELRASACPRPRR